MARRDILPTEGVKRTVPIGFLDGGAPESGEVGLRDEVDSGGGEGCVTERRREDEIGSYLQAQHDCPGRADRMDPLVQLGIDVKALRMSF
jgi:hypothetical protein